MHKIFELKEMDDEKLYAIAAELGIKGAKKKDKDSLIYDIMDKEAVLDSQKAPEKVTRKRGRPRKAAAVPEQTALQEPSAEETSTARLETEAEKTPKKRGRKPKSAQQLQQEKPAVLTENGPEVQEKQAEEQPKEQNLRGHRARIQKQEKPEQKQETLQKPSSDTLQKQEPQQKNEAHVMNQSEHDTQQVQGPRQQMPPMRDRSTKSAYSVP